MLLENNSKFLIIGDSISDFGRARPVGEGLHAGLGSGYPRFLDSLFRLEAPQAKIRVLNLGNDGDTTRSLLARWQRDVLDLKPDYVLIEIGINDVWRHFDEPFRTEVHISKEEYGENLQKLVDLTKDVKKIFFLSPYLMELNEKDPFRALMDEFRAVNRAVAEKNDVVYIDLQEAFDQYFQNFHPTSMNWDRVHPDPTGHLLIAKTIAQKLELI